MIEILCADASNPISVTPLPHGFTAVQGYIGRRTPIRTPTPHIWGASDFGKFPHAYKYPMFVGTPAISESGHPETEAFECLHALWDIGAPHETVVGLDMEVAVDVPYVSHFYRILSWAGFHVWVYGSASSVFKNPVCDGYDVADYTGEPHIHPHPEVRATQYADSKQLGTSYDARLIRPWQASHRMWR